MLALQSLLVGPLLVPIAIAAPSLWSGNDQVPLASPKTNSSKVDVTLYVMSRCPDAVSCSRCLALAEVGLLTVAPVRERLRGCALQSTVRLSTR